MNNKINIGDLIIGDVPRNALRGIIVSDRIWAGPNGYEYHAYKVLFLNVASRRFGIINEASILRNYNIFDSSTRNDLPNELQCARVAHNSNRKG